MFGYIFHHCCQSPDHVAGQPPLLFGFGRSRAKLYSGERPKTAFADVAGVDEVKLERGMLTLLAP